MPASVFPLICRYLKKDIPLQEKMNYSQRFTELGNLFKQGTDCRLPETKTSIRFFSFGSTLYSGETIPDDSHIKENYSFEYPVFTPSGKQKHDKAILLLHGLNERNWSKYLTWAEYLCSNTGKPVILFPIAFHINRSPQSWSTPRALSSLLSCRRNKYTDDHSISFANVALSDRISQNPERFYLSGRQTCADLTSLYEEIKTGRHPLFREGTYIDIFAYSIGAFLSQVALMANPKKLFSDTRLFMFCGGSIFRSMRGISRSIMDRAAFEKLYNYYVYTFGMEPIAKWFRDEAFDAFYRMILPERLRTQRESFFERAGERIKGIVLAQDVVIPYHGVQEALGVKNTEERIELLDFPYPYSHENPFPVNLKDVSSVNRSFTHVFSRVAGFLV